MSAEPYDDDGIDATDVLIRRINPVQHVVWDENRQKNRISPKAYNKSSGLRDGMSVDVESLIISDGLNPREFVTTPVFTAAVALGVGEVRALGFYVGLDPIKDVLGVLDNPYHAEVWAKEARKSFTDGQKKALADLAKWYIELPEVDIR